MAKPRDALPRLNLNPQLFARQPAVAFTPAQPNFSPAVPPAFNIHPHGFHPPFPVNGHHLQTPVQPFFGNPPAPQAPIRPGHHHPHSSLALTSAGLHPANGFPITPMNGHFPRPSFIPNAGPIPTGHPLLHRRRQLSIGGPPKAVLGGPSRKLSPLPSGPQIPLVPPQKAKKIIVNIPEETISGEEGEPPIRPSWARSVSDDFEFHDQEVAPVLVTTAEPYPPDAERSRIPGTLDVFLPGKGAWDEMRRRDIEEKLEKLGVEKGSGSSGPHIYAPHARAASISSPADPQILAYKLNKLQQSQDAAASSNNSLSSSPIPPFGHQPSPNLPPRLAAQRHSHTLSLALPHPPFLEQPIPNTFDPFNPNMDNHGDSIFHPGPPAVGESLYTLQGRHSLSVTPLSSTFRSNSRPDFIRGFGLDIPEEEEEEELADSKPEEQPSAGTLSQDPPGDGTDFEHENLSRSDKAYAAPRSGMHSRHVSRLSAALSTRSAGALDEDDFIGDEDVITSDRTEVVLPATQEEDLDAVESWTGSEDAYEDSDADEVKSIGEWSNPSDEERARQERLERRARRRAAQSDRPRRIPNFPRPPENTAIVPLRADDDIISNPSEEGRIVGEYLGIEYYTHSAFDGDGSALPLPRFTHPRNLSGEHTAHDPAHAHSRDSSSPPNHNSNRISSQATPLNPFAKPFVFGAILEPKHQNGSSDPQNMSPAMGHNRVSSIGKPLNVAAPEFKPGAFNFRPPPGVPSMPSSSSIPPASLIPPAPSFNPLPLPDVPSIEPSPLRCHGREKRPRLGSSNSLESLLSFKFPANVDSPAGIRQAASDSNSLKPNPTVDPFMLSGLYAVDKLSLLPTDKENIPPSPLLAKIEREFFRDESAEKVHDDEEMPSESKPKRVPLPLDFKHPVSSNTVPAVLFKSLINGDERRRTVRSRMGSRETFDHSQMPSMDDLDVTNIAGNINRSRSRLVTDPGLRPASPDDDIFGAAHFRRRSSFTDIVRPIRPLSGSEGGSNPDESVMGLTGGLEEFETDRKLESLPDGQFTELLQNIRRESDEKHSATQTMLSEVQSLFRTQLQDAAARSLEDSQRVARGELDVQLFKDIVECANSELLKSIVHEFQALQQQVWQSRNNSETSMDIASVLEQVRDRIANTNVSTIGQPTVRHGAVAFPAPERDYELIAEKMTSLLAPIMRQESIDYEFLTHQLTQAVKPHITQLIDLASDKKETAGLIVDRIVPLLPQRNVDIDAIMVQFSTEVRRAIGPMDVFDIKEQVADLVVERLDSRLALRDRPLSADNIASKVMDGIGAVLGPLNRIPSSLVELEEMQKIISSLETHISSGQDQVSNLIAALPPKLVDQLQDLKSNQHEILCKLDGFTPVVEKREPDENMIYVRTTVDDIATIQNVLRTRSEEFYMLQKTILEKLNALPEIIQDSTNSMQTSHADLLSSLETARRDADELRKVNNEHQSQLIKSRTMHGQIRVEKDVLDEKVQLLNCERERLRSQVKELQLSCTTQSAQMQALESRNRELEDALAKALTRLQASDVSIQTSQERIDMLEKANHEVSAERHAMKLKVESLELQATFAVRDKESVVQSLATLQQQYDHLSLQESHWDDLRRAADKIDVLATLIGQADNDELKELRRYRDRTRLLESEHAALQKRFKEQESKISNSEKAALTARQSLAQAQQRSSEWERRAKEYEGQLDTTQTRLDQAEQMHAQLEAEHTLLNLQLEEREANERLSKDQQNKLREQVSALDDKVARLQGELERAKSTKAAPLAYRNIPNGETHIPSRPESRASTICNGQSTSQRPNSTTPTTRTNALPQPSVWDSMHAPSEVGKSPSASIYAPRSVYGYRAPNTSKTRIHHQQYHRPAIPSPTPSNVSATPTQRSDGWWE